MRFWPRCGLFSLALVTSILGTVGGAASQSRPGYNESAPDMAGSAPDFGGESRPIRNVSQIAVLRERLEAAQDEVVRLRQLNQGYVVQVANLKQQVDLLNVALKKAQGGN